MSLVAFEYCRSSREERALTYEELQASIYDPRSPSQSASCILIFTSACATSTKLSRIDPAAIHSVAVPKKSDYPESAGVFYYTFGQNLSGSLGGVLGAGIAHAAGGSERERFCALFRAQNIDVGQILINRSGAIGLVRDAGEAHPLIINRQIGKSGQGGTRQK